MAAPRDVVLGPEHALSSAPIVLHDLRERLVGRPLTRAGVAFMTSGKSLHLPKLLFPEIVTST